VVREKSADSTKRLRESRTARWEVSPQLDEDFGSGWGKPWRVLTLFGRLSAMGKRNLSD